MLAAIVHRPTGVVRVDGVQGPHLAATDPRACRDRASGPNRLEIDKETTRELY